MQLAIAVKRLLIVWFVLFGLLQSGVQAQTQWPKQPIRIIVTFTPGDTHILATKLYWVNWIRLPNYYDCREHNTPSKILG